ncbi:MAG: hypothetical protein JWN34_4783 [Bryobacterales bacterium]|nr:hypothetical protein [Bryobacterales bacterium]
MPNVHRLLRFFLPLQNPAGFSLVDTLLLALAIVAVVAILARDHFKAAFDWLADHPRAAAITLTLLPIALRLALLAHHPIPEPSVSDDFSYLLLGDTLAHFRLANAVHPMHRFFETVFVLQEPAYASIYPLGQGLALAFGQLIFKSPWAGVALSVGLFCAAVYWMLRGWLAPRWALLGGFVAVILFGPLNQWMNNYWGGAVSAIAGCLVFGALPRLRRGPTTSAALLLGAGLGMQVLTRPYEALLMGICIVPALLRVSGRQLTVAALAVFPALLLTLMQNHAVTGDWLKLPYMESRTQYGVPAAFTFQPMPKPQRPLVREQEMDYQAQVDAHAEAGNFWPRLAGRIKFLRFFLYAPLYLALVWAVPLLRQRQYLWVAVTLAIFALGTNFYPYFYPHYVAAAACLILLLAVAGLSRLNPNAALLILTLCLARFAFWYSIHLFGDEDLFIATGPYQSWDYINFGDAEGRFAINRSLATSPGQQLVFVRYSPSHTLREWIHNEADIDRSRVVWALDLGNDENAKLRLYYPGRKTWLVVPDERPPKLIPWDSPEQ